ncbi:hypothetical protein [Dactylosporangium sp. NPDC051541]|uniref:hypothetical protein n=1 Tax=Dactylosporangium sp. NPDC051541 TaxID=3363977 RepID=UPI0037B3B1B8
MTYPPQNPDDEPRSEPFRPMSYDLAPEFGTPPPPPASYGQQPPPGQPPPPVYPVSAQPGYGQPTYQQPVTQPPYGQPAYPAPPPAYGQPPVGQPPLGAPPAGQPPLGALPVGYPPKKGKGLKITLGVIGGLFVVCAVIACVAFYPIYRDAGAHVSAPPTLPGGLTKQDSAQSDALKSSMESDLRGSVDSVDEIETGVYGNKDDADPTHLVILVAATGTFFSPGSQVDAAFKGFGSGQGLTNVSSPQEYDAGKLGGTLRCGSSEYSLGTGSSLQMTMCSWSDHGSVGIVLFMGRTVAEASAQIVPIREAVQTRS